MEKSCTHCTIDVMSMSCPAMKRSFRHVLLNQHEQKRLFSNMMDKLRHYVMT